ncbi:J domain-containing protein [Pseudacidovorax sp. RU35E]|uniref:J domain-containing protein n=1 Tax=Pseudacidovorax sp. RU35E TaxID=1907403 RepID=UPI000955E3E6|nr:J domain-containing protein [Pseudacidovorax sp. RU35E]SIR75723.1 DnaJ domain-containing protein [Pseudacidovorax sp. RU35E]
MNHYEVLGVRPTASPQEIELAYRARRTQYHPDKYPQADEATVRWATEQMQQVNEAFETLSDADARARYDAGRQAEGGRATDARPQRPPKREAAAAPAPAPAPAPVSLAALLKQRLGGVTFTRVYLAPYIPPKKLTGAGSSIVLGEGDDKVLVLIDATVFGGAKEGIVLTEEGIHFKELGSSAQRRFWEDIREVEVRGTKVLVNGSAIADCTMCEKRELLQVFGVVREFLLARHAATSSPARTAEMMRRAQQSDTPWTNPVVCQEIFNIARQRVLQLSDLMEPFEAEYGEEILNREELAEFFATAGAAIQDPSKAQRAFQFLVDTGSLCELAIECAEEDQPPSDRDALNGPLQEPQAVRHLRQIVRGIVESRDQNHRSAQARQFFDR